MVRVVALLVCAAPAVVAANPLMASLRGAKQSLRRLGGGDHYPEETGNPEKPTEEPTAEPTEKPADSEEGASTSSPVDPTVSPTKGGGDEEMPAGTFEHLGCYNDNKDDRVLGHRLRSPLMNAEMCVEHCNTRGASYMSLQFGNECWCSREEDLDYERHGGVGVCDIYCEGDETMTCGGYDAFDLYRLDWPEPSTDPEYIECLADAKDDRVLGHMIAADDMTNAMCRTHCEGKKALYYATQWGNECWCGTSDVYADYERHGKGTCHRGCAGEPDVACGGYNAFSLFRLIGDDSPDASMEPTMAPTVIDPTVGPSSTTPEETNAPDPAPTAAPTEHKTRAPHPCKTKHPVAPTGMPVASTDMPVATPTDMPVATPTDMPVATPTDMPVAAPTDMPVAAPTDEPAEQPTDKPVDRTEPDRSGGGGGGGGGDYAELLDLHNRIRCMHDAAPLTWNSDVEAHAKKYARELASTKCGQLVHSSGSGFGENLFMCWGGGGNCYNDKGAMKSLYDGEVTGGTVGSFGGHATQILWKSTTELGCALDTCEKGGDTYEVLVCNYNPPGNYMGELENEVMPRGSASGCGYD